MRISVIVTAQSGIVIAARHWVVLRRLQYRFAGQDSVSGAPFREYLIRSDRRDSPFNLMRCSRASNLSRIAAAIVGSPIQECQRRRAAAW